MNFKLRIESEDIDELRKHAVSMTCQATGAVKAYQKVMSDATSYEIYNAIGRFPGRECVCLLSFKGGPQEVIVDEVSISDYSFDPRVVFRLKTSKGAWAKTQHSVDCRGFASRIAPLKSEEAK